MPGERDARPVFDPMNAHALVARALPGERAARPVSDPMNATLR